MHKEFKARGLEIVGFPTNVGKQEPGGPEEIEKFAREKYGAEFPIMQKSENPNGPDAHDVFKFCRYNSSLYDPESKKARDIPWNWTKFLLNGEGQVLGYYKPMIDPLEIIEDIEKAL